MQRHTQAGGLSIASHARLAGLKAPEQTPRFEMNRSGSSAEILVYQEIDPYWFNANLFLNQLAQLGDVDTIDVRINSVGGVASEAIAIYQGLARHKATKRVWIDAAAYSAASVLAMAASPGELRIAFNARMMIHNAWNIVAGDKTDMRKQGDTLELLDGTIAATYAKRMTEFSKEQVLELMDEETWYDADGAVAAGLADQVFEGDEGVTEPADAANLERQFKNVPRDLLARIRERGAMPPTRTEPGDDAAAVEVAARWAEINSRPAA